MVKQYRKQKQHVRKYKSKSTPTLVNPGIMYVVSKKKGRLSQSKREILQHLSRKKYETGGYLDFGPRGLQQSTQNYGEEDEVSFEEDPDYEVDYHTHPIYHNKFLDYINHFPSKEDIEDFKESDDQAMIIIHDGHMFIVNRTDKFTNMNKNEFKNRLNIMDKRLVDTVKENYKKKKISTLIKEVRHKYHGLGLEITFIPESKKGDVEIPIKVVEEAKKKGRKFRMFDPTRNESRVPGAQYMFKYDVDKIDEINKDIKEGLFRSHDDIQETIYRDAVVNKKKPYNELSQLEKIELNLIRGGIVDKEDQFGQTKAPINKIRGKGSIKKNQYVQETIQTFQAALDDLAGKNDVEGMKMVRNQLGAYKQSVGVA